MAKFFFLGMSCKQIRENIPSTWLLKASEERNTFLICLFIAFGSKWMCKKKVEKSNKIFAEIMEFMWRSEAYIPRHVTISRRREMFLDTYFPFILFFYLTKCRKKRENSFIRACTHSHNLQSSGLSWKANSTTTMSTTTEVGNRIDKRKRQHM